MPIAPRRSALPTGSRSGRRLRAAPRLTWRGAGYWLEGLGARGALGVFGLLPIDAASAFGGWIARAIGPRLRAHRTAERNLRRALPEFADADVARVLRGMWDNIGRTFGEMPHLEQLRDDPARVQVVDDTRILAQLRDDGIGAVLVAGHFGNWEIGPIAGYRAGLNLTVFYRAPNNPYADALIQSIRAKLTSGGYLNKGHEGARRALTLLKQGGHLGILVDQKQNEGIPAAFLGRPAMTTTAPAMFAHRLGLPIASIRMERMGGARFRIAIEALALADSGDQRDNIVETTRRINARLEDWIRARPEQWFWVHRRWPE